MLATYMKNKSSLKHHRSAVNISCYICSCITPSNKTPVQAGVVLGSVFESLVCHTRPRGAKSQDTGPYCGRLTDRTLPTPSTLHGDRTQSLKAEILKEELYTSERLLMRFTEMSLHKSASTRYVRVCQAIRSGQFLLP